MYYSQLDMKSQCYILALYIACFTILFMVTLAYILFSKDKKAAFPLGNLLVFTILETAAMKEMNHFFSIQNEFIQFTKTLDKIPVWLLIVYSIFIIIYSIYQTYKLHNYLHSSLGPFSIKEAIENLPTGIAFSMQDGSLLLSNHALNKLSHLLTNKDMQNGEEFWNDLTVLQHTNLCKEKGQEPIFALKNGEIWKFSKTVCVLDHLDCFQIKAEDITDIYNLSQDLKDINTKLTVQHKTLKELFKNIEYNVSEQVVMNMRINFHDNFGNLTTLTKKSLHQEIGLETTEELLNLWEKITNSLDNHRAKTYDQALKLSQIEQLANKLGCELFIAGELPKEETVQQLMLLAINEMLKNAVYHARAKRLFISLKSSDTEYKLEIQNINTNKISKLKEGGGLSGLRKKVEQAQGTFSIEAGEAIVLRLIIPKEKEMTYV